MKPLYVMLIGLPASGKTTLAHKIVAELPQCDWHVVSTDDYIEDAATAAGSTYDAVFKDTIEAATKDMNERRQFAINLRRNIIHDQTNLTAKSRARKFASVPNNYLRIGIVCDAPTLTRAARLAARPGKVIPADVDAKMIADFQAPSVPDEFTVLALAEHWREALERHV